MIPALEHTWRQVFFRSHKHLKDQELVNLENVHKILLVGYTRNFGELSGKK